MYSFTAISPGSRDRETRFTTILEYTVTRSANKKKPIIFIIYLEPSGRITQNKSEKEIRNGEPGLLAIFLSINPPTHHPSIYSSTHLSIHQISVFEWIKTDNLNKRIRRPLVSMAYLYSKQILCHTLNIVKHIEHCQLFLVIFNLFVYTRV